MLVQIFIPTFNRAEKLRRAVDSVLRQSCRELEVVVLDNHSDDATPHVVMELARSDARVQHVRRERNIGMIGNFNSIADLVTARYFAMLTDDDQYEPNFVETALACFKCHRGVRFVACNAPTRQGDTVVKSQLDTWREGFYPAGSAVRRCLLGHYPLVTNCLFDATTREEFNFHADLGQVSDGFLLTRMFARYDAYVTREITGYWNNDGENYSSTLRFDAIRMADVAIREFELYADFRARHGFIPDGMFILWWKRFLTILVAADRGGFDTVMQGARMGNLARGPHLAALRVAHETRLVRGFQRGLRFFRQLQAARAGAASAQRRHSS